MSWLTPKVNADLIGCELRGEDRMIIDGDTLLALGRLAASWQQRFSRSVIALTSSDGKTAVKEMLLQQTITADLLKGTWIIQMDQVISALCKPAKNDREHHHAA